MGWTDELATEELKGNSVLEKYESSEAALKGLVDAQELIGKKGILPPGEGAAPEAVEAFKNSIKEHADAILPVLVEVPDNADGYEIKIPDERPEELAVNEELLAGFKAKAHELRLSPKQAAEMADWYNKMQIETFQKDKEVYQKTQAEGEAEIKKEFKNDYDAQGKLARAVVKKFGGDETAKFYEAAGFFRHPGTFKMLAGIAAAFGEDNLKDGITPSMEGAKTEDELRQMMRDPRYHDPAKRDKAFVKEVEEGWRRLYPGKAEG